MALSHKASLATRVAAAGNTAGRAAVPAGRCEDRDLVAEAATPTPIQSARVSRAEHSVEIGRPPADVFPYLVEPELMRQWIGGLVAFTPLDGEPRVGARSTQRVEQAGRIWDVESRIVDLVPDERLAAETTASAFKSLVVYELEPTAAGTRLQASADTEVKGLGKRFLGGAAARVAERKLTADLDRLKRLLDGG